jgi:hypothetical protein
LIGLLKSTIKVDAVSRRVPGFIRFEHNDKGSLHPFFLSYGPNREPESPGRLLRYSEHAKQVQRESVCVALAGLILFGFLTQGFGPCASSWVTEPIPSSPERAAQVFEPE